MSRFTAELKIQVPEPITGDFLSKIHYVSEDLASFAFEGSARDRVTFSVKPGAEARAMQIGEQITKMAQKMCRTYRAPESKVLVDRVKKSFKYTSDPHEALEREGSIFFYRAGRYGLGPKTVALMDHFDGVFRALAREMQAPPFQFPSLIGAQTLNQCKYLRTFPHSLNFVSHMKEDLETIERFTKTADVAGEALKWDSHDLSKIEHLLSPSVCFHYYAWLKDSEQPKPLSITALGKCFRYESGNLRGLERLWDFTMREIIFVGAKEFVLERRQAAIARVTEILDEWGLSYAISSANDPFFIDDFGAQATLQAAFDLKFEIRADLPYKKASFAVGSFNYHQDFFGRSYAIQSAASPAHTSCVGFGLERLALAVFAQFGTDPCSWPASLRQAV